MGMGTARPSTGAQGWRGAAQAGNRAEGRLPVNRELAFLAD